MIKYSDFNKLEPCAKRVLRDRSAVAIVEFAVIAPLFFGLLFGIVFWGLALWETNTLQFAAAQAARCNVLYVPSYVVSGKECGNITIWGNRSSYGIPNASSSANWQTAPDVTPPLGAPTSTFCVRGTVPGLVGPMPLIAFSGTVGASFCRMPQ